MRFASALLVAACALLAHCNLGAQDGDTRGEFIHAYCILSNPCCKTIGGGTSWCEQSITKVVPASYDPDAGNACLDAIRAKKSSPDFCGIGLPLAANPACATLGRRGSAPMGGACTDIASGSECALPASGHVACVAAPGGKTACQETRLGNDGEACAGDSNSDGSLPAGVAAVATPAPTGTYCNRAAGLHCDVKCVKDLIDGAPCLAENECGLHSFCPQLTVEKAACTPLGATGDFCLRNEECVSNACDSHWKLKCTDGPDEDFIRNLCANPGNGTR